MLKKLRVIMRNTRLRFMVSYMLITVLLIGGIGAYMYRYYSKSVLESAVSGETGVMYQVKYLCDGYMSLIESDAVMLGGLGDSQAADAVKLIRATGDGSEIVCLSNSAEAAALRFEDVPRAEFNEMLSSGESRVLPAQYVSGTGSDGVYVTIIYPIPGKQRSLICLLPLESLRLETEGEDVSLRSRYIVCNGEIIASSRGFELEDSNISRAAMGVTQSRQRINGWEYEFTVLPGSRDGVSYVSALALTGVRSNAAAVWLGFIAFTLLLAIPCLGFMLYISRKNYKSIEELGKRFGSTDGDDLSSIDEGIRGLEGENAALNTIVADSIPARRHMFVKQLVRGLTGSRAETIAEGAALGIDMAKAYCAVMLIGKGGGRLSAENMRAIAPEGVTVTGMDMLEHNELMLLIFADETALIDSFSEGAAALPQVTDGRLPVAVSNPHDSLDELSGAYLEASAAYESRFIMGSARLLRFSGIPVGGKGHINAAKYLERIKTSIAEADTQSLEICLNELMLYLKGGDMTLFAFRRFYNDIISAIATEAGDAFTPEMYDLFSLSECSSVDELDSILRGVCGRIISTKAKTGSASPVQALMKLLSDNYTNSEFSLASASEELGVPNARLSQEFKSETGMTPADYLTMLRMEQAKKLLAETDLPVRDICAGSGYLDASSFTRRFRIYTGTTPLQYRQSSKNSDLLDT